MISRVLNILPQIAGVGSRSLGLASGKACFRGYCGFTNRLSTSATNSKLVSTRFYSSISDNKSSSFSTSAAPKSDVSTSIDSITIDEFHQKSNFALEHMLDSFEELSENFPEIDPELSQGVFTLELPPNGTYVINKQPPNKQIWMSSPISGPMRYDLVDNRWVSLRDGSLLEETLTKEARDATGREDFVLNLHEN